MSSRGRISDAEYSSAVGKLGSFGGLVGGDRPVRDSPFRNTTIADEVPATEEASGEEPNKDGAEQVPPPLQVVTVTREPATSQKIGKQSTGPVADRPIKLRKSELYTEPVTVPISLEMRDGGELVARQLQRRRTKKAERITANTFYRCCIRLGLEEFQVEALDVVNSEEELLELMRRTICGE